MKKNIEFIKWLFSKKFITAYKQYKVEKNCQHEKWDMDNQIKVIKCRGCGKKAWIKEIKDLFPPKFN